MRFYVLTYDQERGRILDIENYGPDGADAALARRFELDRQYAERPTVEVVLLSAESQEALKLTHGRYFKTVSELVRQ
jgi:hypothetical protein